MNRIRSSEKPIRHSGNRDDIGRRGGIQKIYLGKDVIDYQHLNPRVREDVAQALTQAEVVRAQKEVWDRARFISELGKIAVEQLEGLIGFDNLDDIVKNVINNANDAIESTILKLNSDPRSETQFSSIKQTAQEIDSVVIKLSGNPDDPQQFSAIKQTAEAIDSVVATLNKSPDDPSQFSSIKQTAQEINSMVSKLSGNPDDPQQFSAIKQTAEAIDSVVATLNKNPDDPSQFSSIKQTSQDIENIVATLNSDPEDAGQFSSIRQTASQISQVVSKLNSDPNAADQYSAIRQTAEEIDLRVRKDQVISSINLSPEEIRISGNRVSIDADTLIARKVILAENLDIGRIPSSLPEGGTLFHFDHSLLSTRGLRPLPGYVATLRPGEGRFGGAVAVEEGTTNLWTNPGWLDGTLSGWSTYSAFGGTGIREVVRDARFGYALRLAKTDSGVDGRWGVSQNKTWHQTGSVIADSVYVKVISASNEARLRCFSDYRNSGGSPYYGRGWALNLNTFELYPLKQESTRHLTITPVGDGWYRIEFVTVEEDIVSGTSYYWIDGAPAEVLLAYPQKEAKPFATSFVAGTRAAGVLRYPQLLDKKRGTLSVWINPHVVVNYNNFFSMNLSTGRFLLYFDANGLSRWDFGPTNSGPYAPVGTIVAGQWTMHTLTWDADAGVYRYYVNGEFVGERQYVEPDSLPSTLPTVNNYGALLDELLVLPYTASPEEIRAWYELGAPFYDAAEITVGGRGAVVINEEGAFGYSSNGVKRAGFSTDGKWVAGGRADGTFAVEADEAGLRVTAPGGEVRFNTDTNGNVFVAGELRPSILILPVRES